MNAEEIAIRFLIGGIFVSAFAILSDILDPRSFAGLFGAAPSIALATLLLTIEKQGWQYSADEARSMIGGAIAFCVYAWSVSRIVASSDWSAKRAALCLIPVWLGISLGFGLLMK